MKKETIFIDCTPTWEGILPLLIEGLKNKNRQVYENSMEELKRMARLADKHNSALK